MKDHISSESRDLNMCTDVRIVSCKYPFKCMSELTGKEGKGSGPKLDINQKTRELNTPPSLKV